MIARTRTHVGVYAILLQKDELLVVKKARGPYTGLYDLPGGKIERGESPEQALAREVREETGIIAQSWEPYGEFAFTGHYLDGDKKILFRHLGQIYRITQFDPRHQDLAIQQQDVSGGLWIPLDGEHQLTPFAKRARREICAE